MGLRTAGPLPLGLSNWWLRALTKRLSRMKNTVLTDDYPVFSAQCELNRQTLKVWGTRAKP